MGVSAGLWDMVRYGLRSGLQKEVILGLVQAVVSGVPDDQHFLMHHPQAAAVASTVATKKQDHHRHQHQHQHHHQQQQQQQQHAGGEAADDGEGRLGEEGDEEEIEGELNKEVCALFGDLSV